MGDGGIGGCPRGFVTNAYKGDGAGKKRIPCVNRPLFVPGLGKKQGRFVRKIRFLPASSPIWELVTKPRRHPPIPPSSIVHRPSSIVHRFTFHVSRFTLHPSRFTLTSQPP